MNKERIREIILEEIGQAIQPEQGSENDWNDSELYQHYLKTKASAIYITNIDNQTHFKIQFANQNGNLFAAITQMSMKPVSEPKLVKDPKQLIGMEQGSKFSIDFPK